jgi:hypothetical protein
MPKAKAAIMAAREMSDVPIIASFNMDESNGPLAAAKTMDEYRDIANKMYGDKAAEFLQSFPVTSDADVGRVGMAAARWRVSSTTRAPARRSSAVRYARVHRHLRA